MNGLSKKIRFLLDTKECKLRANPKNFQTIGMGKNVRDICQFHMKIISSLVFPFILHVLLDNLKKMNIKFCFGEFFSCIQLIFRTYCQNEQVSRHMQFFTKKFDK